MSEVSFIQKGMLYNCPVPGDKIDSLEFWEKQACRLNSVPGGLILDNSGWRDKWIEFREKINQCSIKSRCQLLTQFDGITSPKRTETRSDLCSASKRQCIRSTSEAGTSSASTAAMVFSNMREPMASCSTSQHYNAFDQQCSPTYQQNNAAYSFTIPHQATEPDTTCIPSYSGYFASACVPPVNHPALQSIPSDSQ